ncbi:hypothetical protein JXQ70_10295 [bacterium]|nr:hypothetical protein [bacterium]
MLLPRGDVFLENTKVRFVDFETLIADEFESSLKKDKAINGYVSITYPERKDVLIIFDSQIKKGFTINTQGLRSEISLTEVINQAKKDYEGIVNYYRMPVTFIEMLWDSTVTRSVNQNLNHKIVRWDQLLVFHKQACFEGYFEITTATMLGYMRFSQGEADEKYFYQTFDPTQPFSLRIFSGSERHFISEQETIKYTYLDIFKDMLQTTYSIIIQLEEAQTLIEQSLALARQKYPTLLDNVHPIKAGLVDFDQILANIENISPNERRDQFVGCILLLLEKRLNCIQDTFGNDMLIRTLKELKLVQLFHQKALQRFHIADSLIALWKQFDERSQIE